MRYTVYCDGNLVYDPRLPEYTVIDPVLQLDVNEPGTLTFTVPDTNPSAGLIRKLKSRIKVYREGTLIFLGRIIAEEQALNNRRKYAAEGCIAFLIDSLVRPFNFSGTPAQFFSFLLTQHNAYVSSDQQITAGTCTVTGDDDLTTESILYNSAWKLLTDRLIDGYGGYLVLSFDADEKPVLSYLADVPDTATQHIEFGENLISLAVSKDADETYTACVPLGAKLKDIDPAYESEERLTIEDVNQGVDCLVDSTNAALYGILYAPSDLTTWEDIKSPTALLTKGREWLSANGARLKETITLTAVDLHNLDADTEAFRFLDKVTVSCGDILPGAQFILTSMTIPLHNPANMKITLGDSRDSLVSDATDRQKDTAERLGSIEADYTTNSEAREIVQHEITNNTSIIQSAQQILLSALEDYVKTSDYTAFQSTVNSTLSVMSNAIEANFTETTSEITNLNGSVSQEFSAIYGFIRMIASGIVIGESSSQIKLKLENDVLYFFTGDENTVSTENAIAYFSAGKLYVNTVQILTSMRIGPFAWVPESDNLNFKLME